MWYTIIKWKYEEGEGAIKAILKMYHTFKKKNKEIKLPKGWRFSGELRSLTLSNNDCDVYFLIIDRPRKTTVRNSLSLSELCMDKWEIEEHHGQTGVIINHEQGLLKKEAEEIAVELAKALNKERFMGKFKWIIVSALLGALLGALATLIVSNY